MGDFAGAYFNSGSQDFQTLELNSKRKLYEEVILRAQRWTTPDQLMYVVGATRADQIASIRALAPEHFFLVPGIGAQGGDLDLVMKHGMNKQCGLLINSSRAIIYASDGKDFAKKAGEEARKVQQQMSKFFYCGSSIVRKHKRRENSGDFALRRVQRDTQSTSLRTSSI